MKMHYFYRRSLGYLLLLVLIFTGMLFCGTIQKVSAQSTPDTLWSFSKIRADVNEDDTLDYLGREVSIAGIANIETGLLHEEYLQSFVQNDSAGISIFAMDVSTPFSPGDSLVVTGEIQNYNGMAELSVSNYKVFPDAAEEPKPKSLEKAIYSPQEYLGMLVEGEGTIIEKGTVYNGKYLRISPSDTARKSIMIYVTNFHVLYKEFDFDVLSIGDKISVKGVVGEYNPQYPDQRTYKVFLRTPEDLNYAGIPRFYWYLAGGGLGIMIALVTGWIIMLRRQVDRKTGEIQKALDEKNELLKEKQILLQEIHHRVKNNLSIISGLIGLQLDTTDDEAAQRVLKDSQSRIQSMATIHEKLYQTDSLSEIPLDGYLQELVESIHSTFSSKNDSVKLKFDMASVDIDIDKVVPCGLLVNELVVNAFKHAFEQGKEGILEVSLKKRDGRLELGIADNGPGLPEDFRGNGDDSLGLMLIRTFASQLKAETNILADREGAAFKFIFSQK